MAFQRYSHKLKLVARSQACFDNRLVDLNLIIVGSNSLYSHLNQAYYKNNIMYHRFNVDVGINVICVAPDDDRCRRSLSFSLFLRNNKYAFFNGRLSSAQPSLGQQRKRCNHHGRREEDGRVSGTGGQVR